MADGRISTTSALLLVAGAALIGGGVVWWLTRPVSLDAPRPNAPGTTTAVPNGAAPLDTAVDQSRVRQIQLAQRLQAERNWSAAATAWDTLLALPDLTGVTRLEAERNRTICLGERAKPKPSPAPVRPPPPAEPPEKISPENLAEWYPAGKRTRSVATLRMDGRGTNQAWGIQAEAHFKYLLWVSAETEVLESVPATGRLRFRQHFQEVSQHLVLDDKSFELNLGTTPLLSLADGALVRTSPHYRMVKGTVELATAADPGLKRTLTWLAATTGRDRDEMILPEGRIAASQMEKLSGVTLEVEYISGIGITKLQCLAGSPLTEAELLNLADTLSLMMDYYVFPLADRPAGAEWTVDAKDVGGLIAVGGVETQVQGKLHLLRKPARDGSPETVPIAVGGGDVELRSQVSGGRQSARVLVDSGVINFSLRDKLVRQATLKFQVKSLWSDPNSLLFGTEGIRDVKTDTSYEAELLPPTKRHPQ